MDTWGTWWLFIEMLVDMGRWWHAPMKPGEGLLTEQWPADPRNSANTQFSWVFPAVHYIPARPSLPISFITLCPCVFTVADSSASMSRISILCSRNTDMLMLVDLNLPCLWFLFLTIYKHLLSFSLIPSCSEFWLLQLLRWLLFLWSSIVEFTSFPKLAAHFSSFGLLRISSLSIFSVVPSFSKKPSSF